MKLFDFISQIFSLRSSSSQKGDTEVVDSFEKLDFYRHLYDEDRRADEMLDGQINWLFGQIFIVAGAMFYLLEKLTSMEETFYPFHRWVAFILFIIVQACLAVSFSYLVKMWMRKDMAEIIYPPDTSSLRKWEKDITPSESYFMTGMIDRYCEAGGKNRALIKSRANLACKCRQWIFCSLVFLTITAWVVISPGVYQFLGFCEKGQSVSKDEKPQEPPVELPPNDPVKKSDDSGRPSPVDRPPPDIGTEQR